MGADANTPTPGFDGLDVVTAEVNANGAVVDDDDDDVVIDMTIGAGRIGMARPTLAILAPPPLPSDWNDGGAEGCSIGELVTSTGVPMRAITPTTFAFTFAFTFAVAFALESALGAGFAPPLALEPALVAVVGAEAKGADKENEEEGADNESVDICLAANMGDCRSLVAVNTDEDDDDDAEEEEEEEDEPVEAAAAAAAAVTAAAVAAVAAVWKGAEVKDGPMDDADMEVINIGVITGRIAEADDVDIIRPGVDAVSNGVSFNGGFDGGQ